MQTLVYENYSKFIDATDAIKSIGTNASSVTSDTNYSDNQKNGGKNSLDCLISGD